MESAHENPGGVHAHPVVSLISACFWVILWLLSWIKSLAAIVTITLPRTLYAIVSYSMTLTLNFWSFALMFVCLAVALNYYVRWRYLDVYVQLQEPPLAKATAEELHPDVNAPQAPPAFHNYLDEFLQAVRVFGFLEKPVFHELARHLQTRRLIAGDSIALDQDKSFYCVVDGVVQVFAHTGQASEAPSGAWDEEDMNGYQLVNEVGTGGTLSSLFTILSLFTEDVKISWQEDDSQDALQLVGPMQTVRQRFTRADSDVSHFNLETDAHKRRFSTMSSSSTIRGPGLPETPMAEVPKARESDNFASQDRSTPSTIRGDAHYGMVVRATEDATLAVIPAEAFRRLTKKFPKATAHIVQVILTRFSRVTFHAAHRYLGLTAEVLRTEKAINELACHPLPPSFYEGGGLQELRHRFDVKLDEGDAELDTDYFSYGHAYTDSPGTLPIDIGSSNLNGISRTSSESTSIPSHDVTDRPSSSTPALRRHLSRYLVQAGDLHSTGSGNANYRPSGRNNRSTPRVPQSQLPRSHAAHKKGAQMEGGDDDFDLRDEVMSCIAKSIGLLQPPLSGEASGPTSPAFPPTEGGKSRMTPFPSSFGSLSLLDMGDDTSSITGGTASSVVGTDGMSGLDNEVEILFFPAGSTLARAGERNAGLFYVIDGFLDIYLPSNEARKTRSEGKASVSFADGSSSDHAASGQKFSDGRRTRDDRDGSKPLFTVKPGGIAGYLASLCDMPSYVDIKAKTDSYLGFLPSNALERLLEKRPIVLLTLAKRLISLLSPLVLHIDAALDWTHVDAGHVLWRTGDDSDSFYIVINGRLRAIAESESGNVTILGEYGQGDTVGELDVITTSPRRNTVHAIRDTELIRMPQTLFNAVSSRNPKATTHLLRTIASRVREELNISSSPREPTERSRANSNLKTVAILPVSRMVPVDAFARKLHAALETMDAPTAYLNQASMSSHLGRHAFTRMGKLKAAGWLADQEQRYRVVLYVADSSVSSAWTQTCIRQADCIMVVGMGEDPGIGEYERLLLSLKTTARKELVLLHPYRSVAPGSTRTWLKNRPWIHQHIHVELPGLILPPTKAPSATQDDPSAVTALRNLKDRVQSEFKKYRGGHSGPRPQRPQHSSDFARLARRICGKSIGIVLGGGGARGIAHLGLLKALEEHAIPVDHVGGTSIGAFIGGLYAREGDLISSSGRAKQFSGRMGNIWRMLSDVTYPLVAYTTGHEFNRSIYKAFYDLHIEDMWLPFFCNTSNIMTSRMEIHETGYAWRFIRASMTLVGLLPPLCDNGNMLVDGGYMDNLPVSAMFSMGASAVFACDVGSIDDNSPRNFGDYVSGWWLLINRWNPFSDARTVPAITEIQSRLAYASGVRTLEEAKVARGCLYMQMPVHEYGTLQFGKFEEIQRRGYDAASDFLTKWGQEGLLPSILAEGADAMHKTKKQGRRERRNSI
ncbi:patatin-domain-containing protein [Punctularia strigosozonata HHB-11173 SS5]|uniref:patatin-domain-containing protein n=1 Tax=Punctularia strigosozonata (strain HHB-11173) TaxID=741275 RepID=UPI000441762A|nr:patatin-domain-containing protein [Punctularia strigosozonata HHB-11173 SS5]EIN14421.1 patatin-domain-containing protein [Punctularia strigosozonata HHB-11173 SS5]